MIYFGPAQRMVDRVHGETIRWWRRIPCPCFDPTSGRHDRAHTLCGGLGYLKEEQDIATFRAVITGVTSARIYTGIGELIAGDLLCSTWPDEIPLAHLDEVVIPSRSRVDTAPIVRGSGERDRIPFDLVAAVEHLYTLAGPLEAGWTLEDDYLVWAAGIGPSPGERYTLRCVYSPRWEVIAGQIAARRPDPNGQRIPQQVGLKLLTPARGVS